MRVTARLRTICRNRSIAAIAVAMAMLLAASVACGSEDGQPTDAPPTSTAVMPSPTATHTPAPEPTNAPQPTPTPTPTAEPIPTTEPTQPTPGSTPTPGIATLQQILNAAAAAMDALKSGSVKLETKTRLETGLFPIETDVVITGDFQSPDRSQFTAAISSFGLSIQYEAIIIGQEAYQKLPFSDTWEPGPDALVLLGESGYLGQFNLNLDDEVIQLITLVRSEVLEGDNVYYLEGVLPAYVFAELTGDTAIEEGSESYPVDMGLWIGVEDLLVRKLAIEYQRTDSTSEDKLTVEIVLTYSSYDKPVDIQAP